MSATKDADRRLRDMLNTLLDDQHEATLAGIAKDGTAMAKIDIRNLQFDAILAYVTHREEASGKKVGGEP